MARRQTRRTTSASNGSNGADARSPSDGDTAVLGFIEPIEIQEEMERSFLEYSMSVIVSRALPDVRDGLKPVHRRILYSMFDQNLQPDRPHVKCAAVVGEVMGTYHPHGDSAIYDALVRMVQDFSLRHPLIDGHGNFGGTGPDEGPAAMRYTECRLQSLALDLMAGIDEETVDFTPNYSNSTEEPVVLPARFPNLLVNGSQGIAVGMATNIPPHNLGEVIDATIHLLEHPEATPDDLMAVREGSGLPDRRPDPGAPGHPRRLPHRPGLDQDAGRRRDRGGPERHPHRGDRAALPDLGRGGRAEDRRPGEVGRPRRHRRHPERLGRHASTRLVIRLKRDANANVVLNKLYKHTPLQTSFGVNMLALVDGVPRTLNLAQVLTHYVAHQVEVVTRRTEFRLRKAQARAHIVEGLLRAIDMLDAIIAAIRASDDRPAARARPDGGAVLLQRGAGQPHPGHDPGPAHPAGPDRARGGDGRSCARPSPSSRRSWPTRPGCGGSSPPR